MSQTAITVVAVTETLVSMSNVQQWIIIMCDSWNDFLKEVVDELVIFFLSCSIVRIHSPVRHWILTWFPFFQGASKTIVYTLVEQFDEWQLLVYLFVIWLPYLFFTSTKNGNRGVNTRPTIVTWNELPLKICSVSLTRNLYAE